MIRNVASYVLFCLLSVSLLGTAVAQSSQQTAEHPATETVKVAAQKSKTTSARPVSAKPSKSAATATAKADDKPGKRFWGRIMSCFRDVHSVEKKTNK